MQHGMSQGLMPSTNFDLLESLFESINSEYVFALTGRFQGTGSSLLVSKHAAALAG